MKLITYTCAAVLLGSLPFQYLRAEPPDNKPKREHHRRPMAVLDEAEREKLWSALKEVKDAPEIAKSRDEVKKAMDDHRKVLAEALIKKDPSLAPVIEKLGDAFPPHPRHDGDMRDGRKKLRKADKPNGSATPNEARKQKAEEFMDAAE